MPRRTKPFTIIEEFAPDPARCAAALVKLLLLEPPADTPATAQDATWGETSQAEPAEPDKAP